MKRLRWWLCALAALAALPAAAKVDDPNDLIRGRWYATEVIIFERADAAGPGPEELVWEGGRAWPARVRAFAEPKPWRIASLDPLTRACLEFPRLEVTRPYTRPTTKRSPGTRVDAFGNVFPQSRENLPPKTAPAPGASAEPNGDEAGQPLPSADAMPPQGMVPFEPTALVPPPPIDPILAPHPLLHLLSAAAQQQAVLRRDSYRWLPAPTHALKTEARRLGNSQGLDIIWHGRWIQPVPSRSAGEPLMLAVQSTADHGRLSGTLQVTLGRYLHFDARLWLEQPLTRRCLRPTEGWSPGARADSCDNPVPRSMQPKNQSAAVPYMQLEQARTMRSGELHYLDHPRMGVLVRIDPLPPSPALVRALQAWEASS